MRSEIRRGEIASDSWAGGDKLGRRGRGSRARRPFVASRARALIAYSCRRGTRLRSDRAETWSVRGHAAVPIPDTVPIFVDSDHVASTICRVTQYVQRGGVSDFHYPQLKLRVEHVGDCAISRRPVSSGIGSSAPNALRVHRICTIKRDVQYRTSPSTGTPENTSRTEQVSLFEPF
ncbi:unnamed protein product, partial [Iphiclides podalirius]